MSPSNATEGMSQIAQYEERQHGSLKFAVVYESCRWRAESGRIAWPMDFVKSHAEGSKDASRETTDVYIRHGTQELFG